MHHLFKLMLALAGLFLAASVQAQPPAPGQASGQPTAQQQERARQMKVILDSLHPQTGTIRLPAANASLHLGDDYYFLSAEEARKVLVDGWGNHPDSAIGVLGLVFPKGKTFLDDTWAAMISFDETGYVTDEDSQSADYAALLSEMQSGEPAMNAKRTQEGYPAQHLVGWAQPPVYDVASHSVVWARNLRFSDQDENVLNYDIRLLGRRGVLSLNMLTVMSKLGETKAAAAKFARSAEFDSGARYADFKQGDATAGYGLAGLVAAGVGVVAVKKLGLLAIILGFGKKFIIIILAALGGLGARFRRLFGLKGKEEAAPEADYHAEPEAPAAGTETGEPGAEPGTPDRSWVG